MILDACYTSCPAEGFWELDTAKDIADILDESDDVKYWSKKTPCNLEDSPTVAFLLTAGECWGVELGSTRAATNTTATRPRRF
ncbi:hypothetical protein KIN20_019950 [Parelaphostrongylus tenuis]|uniref:Uncharacterized protein n=1 Tax=Parelaphostrongylus tenuis TaxID=148309 RepID=A0AAD5MLW6_PARTN|nr:hypothetical protein KIN20_019950 [Parelaphostrongylus tenuis]